MMTYQEAIRALQKGKCLSVEGSWVYIRMRKKLVGLYRKQDNSLIDSFKDLDTFLREEDKKTGETRFQVYKIPKKPEPIISAAEKKYLASLVKPFRNDYEIMVYKLNSLDSDMPDDEYIAICFDSPTKTYTRPLIFPSFPHGTRYKNMKKCQKYTLEELGI